MQKCSHGSLKQTEVQPFSSLLYHCKELSVCTLKKTMINLQQNSELAIHHEITFISQKTAESKSSKTIYEARTASVTKLMCGLKNEVALRAKT